MSCHDRQAGDGTLKRVAGDHCVVNMGVAILLPGIGGCRRTRMASFDEGRPGSSIDSGA